MRLLPILLVLGLSSTAAAAPRFYGWTYRDAVNEEGNAEYETWLHGEGRDSVESSKSSAERRPWQHLELWVGGTIGLGNGLELAVFGQGLAQNKFGAPGAPASPLEPGFGFKPQVRWNALAKTETRPFGLMLMFDYENHFFATKVTTGYEGRAVASYAWRGLDVTANVAFHMDHLSVVSTNAMFVEHDLAASWAVAEWLRVGAEEFGYYRVSPTGIADVMVGPALTLFKGRFWWTFSHGFRLNKAEEAKSYAAIRSIVGIAF